MMLSTTRFGWFDSINERRKSLGESLNRERMSRDGKEGRETNNKREYKKVKRPKR